MKKFIVTCASLGLAMLLSACASVPTTSADEISYNDYEKIEISGLYIPSADPNRPLFLLGSMGRDAARTPAVYGDSTEPLQAVYIERDPETGVETLEVRDGNTNCGSFGIGTNSELADIEAGIDKAFCMGIGGQDLGAGLGAGAADD